MDGGSRINILYLETLHRMKLSETQLEHSNITFHGVVPGRKAKSLGDISLDVTFGTPKNFRVEKLYFKVVLFKSAYHAIFRRPAFAKFMARSCYIYNKLKLPGPNGIITVKGDYKKAHKWECGNAAFAESILHAKEFQQIKCELNPKEMPALKKPSLKDDIAFTPSEQMKQIQLVDGEVSKMATIGAALDTK
jgi:hypothetical protein